MTIGRPKSDVINRMFSSYILSSILVMVSVPIHQMTDGILMNRAVSPDALSMITLLTPVNIFFFAIKAILVTGLSILSARALGERDYQKGSQLFTVALSSNAVVILSMTALAYLFFPKFVGLFCPVDSPIYPLLYDYAKIILLQFPLLAILSSLDTYMRLAGKARLVSVSIIVSCALNIVLTWLFLNVLKMGIKGAAIATILCSVSTKLSYLPYLVSGKFPFRIARAKLSVYMEILRQGVGRGSPSAVNDIVMSVIFFATNGIILRSQGTQGMFIWSVMLQMLSLAEMIAGGFTGVIQHIGGVLSGENDNQGFRLLIRKSFIIQLLLILAVVIPCIVFPESVLNFFTDGVTTVTDRYVRYFIIGVLMLLPMRACISITETMNVCGHTGLALTFNLLYLVSIFLAAFSSVLFGPVFFWVLLPVLQAVVLMALMATTLTIHLKNNGYFWFALLPTMPDGVSMLMAVEYDMKEIPPVMENVSKFLSIAELPNDIQFSANLICEELVYHVISEKESTTSNTFEIQLSDKQEELTIIVKEVGKSRDLDSFLKAETLSAKIVTGLAPEAKYDYFNGVCVVSICINKTKGQIS